MFDDMHRLSELTDENLEDRVAVLAAHIDAALFEFLQLIAEVDRRQQWGTGFVSTGHWLSWRVGIDRATAREKVRVARAIETLPKTSAAMRTGELSYSKARALTRIATPETEQDLLHIAYSGTAAHLESVVRTHRRISKCEASEAASAQHEQRTARYFYDSDGSFVLEARLAPEVGALVQKALEAAQQMLWKETNNIDDPPKPSAGQKRADAVVRMAELALTAPTDKESHSSSSADKYQVVVHVDAQQCHVEDGPNLCSETSRRLLCDSSRVEVTHGPEGEVLNVGRKTRQISSALRRALRERDKGCCWPGCAAKYFVEAHHIRHWSKGGETKLANLANLCKRHHRLVHEGGWSVELAQNGAVQLIKPTGQPLPRVPCHAPLTPHAVKTLIDAQRGSGLRVSAETSWCNWGGERMDVEDFVFELLETPNRKYRPLEADDDWLP